MIACYAVVDHRSFSSDLQEYGYLPASSCVIPDLAADTLLDWCRALRGGSEGMTRRSCRGYRFRLGIDAFGGAFDPIPNWRILRNLAGGSHNLLR